MNPFVLMPVHIIARWNILTECSQLPKQPRSQGSPQQTNWNFHTKAESYIYLFIYLFTYLFIFITINPKFI